VVINYFSTEKISPSFNKIVTSHYVASGVRCYVLTEPVYMQGGRGLAELNSREETQCLAALCGRRDEASVRFVSCNYCKMQATDVYCKPTELTLVAMGDSNPLIP
jgi:hypothetical protein